jgi:hypothetical protein
LIFPALVMSPIEPTSCTIQYCVVIAYADGAVEKVTDVREEEIAFVFGT